MNADEAIARLDAIDGRDTEVAHSDADDVLLSFVPDEVADAWRRVAARAGGF